MSTPEFPSTAPASSLTELLAAAYSARSELMSKLENEKTNAYRLFHGSVEGVPGLTVDRYGKQLLLQSFHRPVNDEQLAEITAYYDSVLPGFDLFYNDRSLPNSRVRNALPASLKEKAHEQQIFQELGINYLFQARHEGQDPWLFLDLRATRRHVMREAAGKSVLNLFAYTCGVGIVAAKGGAKHVVNVDFAESSLFIGKENARLNELPIRVRFTESDVFPVVRQYAGLGQQTMVRGKRMPNFPKLEKHEFDLVFLDPPRYAKSLFGVVDLVNDYPALFKPALLCTAEGGSMICTNNVAEVKREDWLAQLERCAVKAGRTIRAFEWIEPEGDFPSHDGQPPLKAVILRV